MGEIDFNISEKHEIFHNKSLKKKLDSGGKDIYKMLVNYIKAGQILGQLDMLWHTV